MKSITGRRSIRNFFIKLYFPVISFPNCKINIGLNIISKRNDGYHNIETIFFPLPWHDALEVVPFSEKQGLSANTHKYVLTFSGITVPGNEADNICLKACQMLKKDFPDIPAVHLHLHKTIPIGAGLGGGSSNGAATLLLLNKRFNLNLSTQQLAGYALQLGSDCPFFIINQPCYASGRGEKMESTNLNLSAYSFLIVYPGTHIHTAWAFSKLIPMQPVKPIKTIIQQPVETWKKELYNDFELPVFNQYPEIANVKKRLYDNGALYASMTGSGSSVYGIFNKNNIPALHWDKNYLHKAIL